MYFLLWFQGQFGGNQADIPACFRHGLALTDHPAQCVIFFDEVTIERGEQMQS